MSKIQELRNLFKRQHSVVEAYHKVFDRESPFSEQVMVDLMQFTNMLQPTFNATDSSESLAFEEGKRAVMLYILSKLQVSPAELYERLLEASKQGDMNV